VRRRQQQQQQLMAGVLWVMMRRTKTGRMYDSSITHAWGTAVIAKQRSSCENAAVERSCDCTIWYAAACKDRAAACVSVLRCRMIVTV
jgi:hypothetical protein